MRLFLLAVLGFQFSSLAALHAEPFWISDLDDALYSAQKEHKKLLVDYYAAWCPPCQELDKDVFRTDTLKPYESQFLFVHLDGDTLPSKGTFRKYPVTGYPTVWILDEAGKPLGRHVGFESKAEFLEFIDESLSGRTWSEQMEARIKKSPEDPDVLGEAFSGALVGGDTKKAEELKAAIKRKREEWDGTYERVLLDEAVSALYAPEPDYAAVLRLADTYLVDFPQGYFAPAALHVKAKALRGSGKAADADTLVASLPSRFPASSSAFWRVLEYSRLNGVLREEAGKTLDAGLKTFPKDQRFLTQAVLFLKDSDAKRAAQIAQDLKKLNPGNAYYDDLISAVNGRKG